MSKTVIFGATGHIGSALARQLHDNGVPLHLAGRNKADLSALADEVNASFSEFDAMDNSSISQAIADADTGGRLGGLVWA
ncbi:MAG: SDR family NAD(P)-dependent oxidoreductase, partial [Candidatus Puniceispirillaceae bacterium]